MMWRAETLLRVAACLSFLIWLPVSAQAQADMDTIEQSLVCICGCGNMILFNCMCADADQMRAEIRGLIAEGKDEKEVIRVLVDRYGEIILAAPVREGFNLTAYVMPFLAILVAGGLLVSFIRRWKRDAGIEPGRADQETLSSDDPYRQKLEEELKSYRD